MNVFETEFQKALAKLEDAHKEDIMILRSASSSVVRELKVKLDEVTKENERLNKVIGGEMGHEFTVLSWEKVFGGYTNLTKYEGDDIVKAIETMIELKQAGVGCVTLECRGDESTNKLASLLH